MQQRKRRKNRGEKESACGEPSKHKATACDTRGQCSLAISVAGHNHTPEKSASQAKALLKKDHSFVLSYTITFEAFHDVQVLVTQNAFLKSILSFRVNNFCNVNRNTMSRKAENLKHIYA